MTIISLNVNSSFIQLVRYNVEELELDILFRDGRCYRHFDVGFDIVEDLEASESAGVFYNDNIRDVFTYDIINYIGTAVVAANTHHFQSSFLQTAQYDANRGHCTITLANGRQYTYELCRAAFYELISAESAGAYFNNFISRLAVRVA